MDCGVWEDLGLGESRAGLLKHSLFPEGWKRSVKDQLWNTRLSSDVAATSSHLPCSPQTFCPHLVCSHHAKVAPTFFGYLEKQGQEGSLRKVMGMPQQLTSPQPAPCWWFRLLGRKRGSAGLEGSQSPQCPPHRVCFSLSGGRVAMM